MKKILVLLCVLLAVSQVVFAGGGKQETVKITKLEDLQGKIVAISSSPQDPVMVRAFTEQQAGITLKDMLFFDTYSAAIAALKSNKADAALLVGPMLNFFTSRDATLNAINLPSLGTTTVHMAVRVADTELRDNINSALISMKDDGTLAALEKKFITDLTPAQQLEGKDMPKFADAPTLKVGISGETPPLDYVAANGKPAGYNVELLALLGEKLGVNLEISVMPLESKFPALASGKIDFFFFQIANTSIEAMKKTLETNNNAVITEPYYEFSNMGFIVLK